MGVPSFYRWLVGKYPKSVVHAVDESHDSHSNNPNPNGEFDNLYLDMNGIVHPCFHPDDEIFGPTTLDEVFLAIFDYIDHLFRIVRPRKVLFLAVDGVAPRAKLNQQRARRYRTAKDAEIAEIEENRLRKEFERAGKELIPKPEYSDVCDSNVITPGTVFMQKLSTALEYYIRLRLNNDPSWKSILVILSDANVPGEGEHKIMSFIRLQRSLPGYDPITRHCLYGLDADLIMLALATHEIHFSILREDVLKKNEEINISTFVASFSQEEHDIFKTRQWFKQIETTHRRAHKKPYQLLNIWTFREYLELDMKPEGQSVVDIERIVDDFIFICFFSGNDFLPHLPSIEIHEGGIDLLIEVYKKMFKSMGGYLVDTSRINERSTSYINFQGVKIFISEIGSYEDRIFVKRSALRKKKMEKLLQDQENEENDRIDFCNSEFSSMEQNFNRRTGASAHILNSFSEKCTISSPGTIEASSSIPPDEDVPLQVKLGCFGWKARYYREKFSAENAKEIEAKRIALNFVKVVSMVTISVSLSERGFLNAHCGKKKKAA
ncbi:5'-3' exoribonuclease 3 [Platanthera guangdongensis]|uniref:5'-3' exoribonuclease 3 n=1 Tax=Platanthera guangdongensis TaxID=2320717 RepID=A0ABR2M2G4_9ASPA